MYHFRLPYTNINTHIHIFHIHIHFPICMNGNVDVGVSVKVYEPQWTSWQASKRVAAMAADMERHSIEQSDSVRLFRKAKGKYAKQTFVWVAGMCVRQEHTIAQSTQPANFKKLRHCSPVTCNILLNVRYVYALSLSYFCGIELLNYCHVNGSRLCQVYYSYAAKHHLLCVWVRAWVCVCVSCVSFRCVFRQTFKSFRLR